MTNFLHALPPLPLFFTLLFLTGLLLLLILRKSIRYKYLNEDYLNLQTHFVRTEQRFADSLEQIRKLEAENASLRTIILTSERELSAVKAASAAQKETLSEKIAYLEKIKEDLTLKFKNISAETIKSQQESFSKEQKTRFQPSLRRLPSSLKHSKPK